MVIADLIRATLRLIGAISSSETPVIDESSDALEAPTGCQSMGCISFLSAKDRQSYPILAMVHRSYIIIGVAGDINTTRPTAIYNAFWSTGA